MGIVESILAEFELSDSVKYRVEYNEGDIIHMHIDSLRIDFSEEEFMEFADVVEEGYKNLQKDKNIE